MSASSITAAVFALLAYLCAPLTPRQQPLFRPPAEAAPLCLVRTSHCAGSSQGLGCGPPGPRPCRRQPPLDPCAVYSTKRDDRFTSWFSPTRMGFTEVESTFFPTAGPPYHESGQRFVGHDSGTAGKSTQRVRTTLQTSTTGPNRGPPNLKNDAGKYFGPDKGVFPGSLGGRIPMYYCRNA